MKPFTPAQVKPAVSADVLASLDVRVGTIVSVADVVPNGSRAG
jgi:hypothetical protein